METLLYLNDFAIGLPEPENEKRLIRAIFSKRFMDHFHRMWVEDLDKLFQGRAKHRQALLSHLRGDMSVDLTEPAALLERKYLVEKYTPGQPLQFVFPIAQKRFFNDVWPEKRDSSLHFTNPKELAAYPYSETLQFCCFKRFFPRST
mmetsp:Transcript_2179/g.4595  ORF Transcript_2179/g.4595 Transcript_2179/m.4595 type:complete len:147 (+) Transcript_2179:523-963(+)